MSTSNPTALCSADFYRDVVEGKRPSMIGFTAVWCVPCRAMGVTLANLNRAMGERVLVTTIDIDDESILAEQLGIDSVPTLVFFQSGVEVKRLLHMPHAGQLERLAERVLFGADD
jgi:thioredoxin 1